MGCWAVGERKQIAVVSPVLGTVPGTQQVLNNIC